MPAQPDINMQLVQAALRDISRGYATLADALAGSAPKTTARKEAVARVLEKIPAEGITTPDLSELFRAEGLHPRSIGSLVRFGQIVADEENLHRVSGERIYYPGSRCT